MTPHAKHIETEYNLWVKRSHVKTSCVGIELHQAFAAGYELRRQETIAACDAIITEVIDRPKRSFWKRLLLIE